MFRVDLTDTAQFEALRKQSFKNSVWIFKHSTRCPISALALNRLRADYENLAEQPDIYYLDLLRYRSLSDHISEQLAVQHESPQLLRIEKGECTYHASHNGIRIDALEMN